MTLDDIVNDMARRYGNTYVFVQEPNSLERNLFLVELIETQENRAGVIHLFSDEVGRIKINVGSAHTLLFVPPPVGVYQSGIDACFCRRLPQRQYRRGICPDNTVIGPVTQSIDPHVVRRFEFALIRDMFEKKTFSFRESIGMLSSEKFRSVALKGGYAVSASMGAQNNPVLFFFDIPIAKLTPEGKLAEVLEAVYSPQINQIIGEE